MNFCILQRLKEFCRNLDPSSLCLSQHRDKSNESYSFLNSKMFVKTQMYSQTHKREPLHCYGKVIEVSSEHSEATSFGCYLDFMEEITLEFKE